MAKLLSFVTGNGAPVNIELLPDAEPRKVIDLILGTPPGRWCYLTTLIDGREEVVHLRPDSFGMFFVHEK